MRVERASGEADVGRAVVSKPAHQTATAAQYADRKTTTDRLSIRHQVGGHAKVFLHAATCHAEAKKDLVEDEHDSARGAHVAKTAKPFGVCCLVVVRDSFAGHERSVRRWWHV